MKIYLTIPKQCNQLELAENIYFFSCFIRVVGLATKILFLQYHFHPMMFSFTKYNSVQSFE